MSFRCRFAFLLAAGVAAATGCGGAADGGDPGLTPPGGVSVLVAPSDVIISVGKTEQMAVLISGTSNLGVTWKTDAPSVATVSNGGMVTAIAAGTARITATSMADPSKSDAATVTVTPSLVNISLSVSPATATIAVGATQQVTATVTGGSSAVNWSTSSASIATVSSSGLVTGVAAGTATITATAVADPTKTAKATITVAAGASGGSVRWSSMAAGSDFVCALNESGRAYCWGVSTNGVLANGSTSFSQVTRPTAIQGSITFAQLTAGASYACGRTPTGEVYCWGANREGELGTGGPQTGSAALVATPTRVSGSVSFADVSSKFETTCGRTASGAGYCWGENSAFQTGAGIAVNSPVAITVPTAVAGGLTFTALVPGDQHTCGLTTDGSPYCVGDQGFKQLGNGENGVTTRTMIRSLGGPYRQLATTRYSTCGLASDGTASCWGFNGSGQLGRTTSSDRTGTPAPIETSLKFQQIFGGSAHFCGLTADGTAYCWGDNSMYEIGDGSTVLGTRTEPTAVAGGLKFTKLALGYYISCGLTADGAMYCWGQNSFGTVSPTGGSRVNTPTRIQDP